MAEKLDPKELVSFKEALMSEVIQSEGLINLLDRKGIITKQELLEEIKRVQTTLPISESEGKRTSKITREDALEIAKRKMGILPCIDITDKYSPGWAIYSPDRLVNCWYFFFQPSLIGTTLGQSYMVAVSKEDGGILWSGLVGE
jgi:hypothetical protein